MSVNHPLTARLVDEAIPALGVLLGDGVPEPLGAVVAGTGSRITKATATGVTWWPGSRVTVQYAATLRGGPLAGQHNLVAVSGRRVPEGAAIVENQGVRVGVWRVPHDPRLPGLPRALDPGATRKLLVDLGAPDEEVTTHMRAYRPGSRAVVQVSGPHTSVFLKVVREGRAERLHASHRSLPADLPVPLSLGYSSELGLVALQAMPGHTLRDVLEDGTAALPPGQSLMDLLHRLPQVADGTPSLSPIERLPDLTRQLKALLPWQADRIDRLVESIGPETEDPSVPVHGDLYEAQLLVEDGAYSGMIDVDTFGLGRPADDAATMIGHLSLWQTMSRQPERVRQHALDLLRLWDARVDPVDLRRRAAAVIVTLASGPFRTQSGNWPDATVARLALAEHWVASAETLAKAGV